MVIRLFKIRMVISAAFADAGDTVRSVAIADALRRTCPPDYDLHIDFLSCGSRFDHQITDAGFNICRAEPRVEGVSVAQDLGWDFPEFFRSEERAKQFIQGQRTAFEILKPDIVLHGMWPPASIAARLLKIRTINFLPIPLHPASFRNGLLSDLPDRIPLLTMLPRPTRTRIAQWKPYVLMYHPIFRQHRFGAAARECGWPGKGPISLFEMNMADLNLVNDHPIFYQNIADSLPSNIKITGPIYNKTSAPLDRDIVEHMERKLGRTILVAMGSSGTKEWIFEAIQALTMDKDDDWNAVVLAPPSICPLRDALAVAKNNPRLLVTDRFIPTTTASELADVVIVHGGQGTVQTALAAQKPLVGVALQLEQQINLDHVMDAGAGIRIQEQRWKAKNIRKAVKAVLSDPSYAENAKRLGSMIRDSDGATRAAKASWEFIRCSDDRAASKVPSGSDIQLPPKR